MFNQQSLGIQLGRDVSAAGVAHHRLTTQRKSLEVVESVGAARKSDFERVKKYFRLELQFLDKEHEDMDEDLDFRALENGCEVIIIPLLIFSRHIEPDVQTAASNWITAALNKEQQLTLRSA